MWGVVFIFILLPVPAPRLFLKWIVLCVVLFFLSSFFLLPLSAKRFFLEVFLCLHAIILMESSFPCKTRELKITHPCACDKL